MSKLDPLKEQKVTRMLVFVISHGEYFLSRVSIGTEIHNSLCHLWLSIDYKLWTTNLDLEISLVSMCRYSFIVNFLNNVMLILVRYNSDQQ